MDEYQIFKNWDDYTSSEKLAIRSEAKTRGVSELYVLAERNTFYAIELAKEKALAEIKLAKAELEA